MVVVASNKSQAGCPALHEPYYYDGHRIEDTWESNAYYSVAFNKQDAKGIVKEMYDRIKPGSKDRYVGAIRYGNSAKGKWSCRSNKCAWLNTDGSRRHWSSVFSVVNC